VTLIVPTSMSPRAMTLPWLITVSTAGGSVMSPTSSTSGVVKSAYAPVSLIGASASNLFSMWICGGLAWLPTTNEKEGELPS
jgi:hypothetical protein